MNQKYNQNEKQNPQKLDNYVLKGMLTELGEHLNQAGILFAEINKRVNSLKLNNTKSTSDTTDTNEDKTDEKQDNDDLNTPDDTSLFVFKIMSETNSQYYDINYYLATCSCPHFKYSGPRLCKHLKKVYLNFLSFSNLANNLL